MRGIDLHMHSCYSIDGEFTPAELIRMAKEKDLEIVALSDHNLATGVDEMIALGNENGIRVIPAIEFDTDFEGIETHVLGYGLDHHQPYFETISEIVDASFSSVFEDGMKNIIEYYGAFVDIEESLAEIEKGGNPVEIVYGRILRDPRNDHIEAFAPFRPNGNRSNAPELNFHLDIMAKGMPCYVEVELPSLQQTVEQIQKHGGIAIIAHPWKSYYQNEELLDRALSCGIEGIEAYSNYHEPYHNEFYVDFCKKRDILITCGSDFHGSYKKAIQIGEYGCTEDAMELCKKFLERLDNK